MKIIKKVILAIGLSLLTTTATLAQTEDTKPNGNETKFVYCDMVGTQKFLSNKMTLDKQQASGKTIE